MGDYFLNPDKLACLVHMVLFAVLRSHIPSKNIFNDQNHVDIVLNN